MYPKGSEAGLEMDCKAFSTPNLMIPIEGELFVKKKTAGVGGGGDSNPINSRPRSLERSRPCVLES